MSRSNNSKKLRELCIEQERRKENHVNLDTANDFEKQQIAQLEAFRLAKEQKDRTTREQQERAAQEQQQRTAREQKERTDRERAAQEQQQRTDRERDAQEQKERDYKEPTAPIVSISSGFNVGDKVYSLVSDEKGTINHIFSMNDIEIRHEDGTIEMNLNADDLVHLIENESEKNLMIRIRAIEDKKFAIRVEKIKKENIANNEFHSSHGQQLSQGQQEPFSFSRNLGHELKPSIKNGPIRSSSPDGLEFGISEDTVDRPFERLSKPVMSEENPFKTFRDRLSLNKELQPVKTESIGMISQPNKVEPTASLLPFRSFLSSSDESPARASFGSSIYNNKEADKKEPQRLPVNNDEGYEFFGTKNRVPKVGTKTNAVDLKDPIVLKRYASLAYIKELKGMERDIRGLKNKGPSESAVIPADIKKGFDNLRSNKNIFKAEDIVYTPKVSDTMVLDQFSTELTFASFDITKMSKEDNTHFLNFYNNRIYNKLYDACIWMDLHMNSEKYSLNNYTMIFLIYEKDTYNIISVCSIKDNKHKKSTEDLKQIIIVDFCNSINTHKSNKASYIPKDLRNEKDLIDIIYPYKGLGSIMMDKVLVAIKEHFNGATVEINLIPTEEAEKFYKHKGFNLTDELTGKLSMTYNKYMKYKDKYMKLKNLMTKN